PKEKYGRDHNPWGFSMWMAGGGVKGGQAIGSTDEIGLRAVDEPHHIWDIHASILYLLGLDHLETTYMRNGRAARPPRPGGESDHQALGVMLVPNQRIPWLTPRGLQAPLVRAGILILFGFGARAQSLPDGQGKQTFEVICSVCHEPTKVLDKQMTRAQWKD